MAFVRSIIHFLAFLCIVVLVIRLVFDWIRVFARDWRPRGPVLLIAEPIYTLTDPPLRALRKVIPSLNLGGVSLDLSFMALFFAVWIVFVITG